MVDLSEERKRLLAEQNERSEGVVKTINSTHVDDFIVEVTHSEVYYTIHPRRLQFSRFTFSQLREKLQSKYRLVYHPSDQSDLNPSYEDHLVDLSQGRRKQIVFVSGLYEIKGQPAVEIISVSFTREGVIAAVQGHSNFADLVAKEVSELVFDLGGSPTVFDNLGRDLQLKSYATETMVDLGIPFNKLLSASMTEVIDKEAGDSEGCLQFTVPEKINEKNDRVLRISWAVDDIIIRVSAFNESSGENHISQFKFSVKTRSDYGGTVIGVSSQLPYERHVSFLRQIIKNMGK